MIAAAVFFGLWFVGVRNASKGKGSSVTSSQATMTQDDIFYVNPSLSDQGQQEYSQSGSENYYEVSDRGQGSLLRCPLCMMYYSV